MSAVILPLPAKLQRTAKRRLDKVELTATHSWIMTHCDDWDNVETAGRCYLSAKDAALQPRLNKLLGMKEPTVTVMRKDITEGRNRIEKRNRIKQWLRTHGATDADLDTPETALGFMFDKMRGNSAGHVARAPMLEKIVPHLAEAAAACANDGEHGQNSEQSGPEMRGFNTPLDAMLKAFIRKELGANPVKPKLCIVRPQPIFNASVRAED